MSVSTAHEAQLNPTGLTHLPTAEHPLCDLSVKMATRRITQETFDAAVRENMEEFEMEPDEALREAVEQFESQGKVQDNSR